MSNQMTDAQIIKFAAAFRDGILDGGPSKSMCAAVSWPLAALLRCNGVPCETVESDLSEELGLLYANHIWIRLSDGRALDPTADQFNPWGTAHYPPVYLGPPTEIHAAQGTDARSSTTVEQGVVHDGPVAKPCAQTLSGGDQ